MTSRLSPRRTLLALALLGVVLLPLLGCGYTTRRLTAYPEAQTIAVVPFENLGYRRDLELRLTQAVVDEIRERTALAITTPDRADLVLTGQVKAEEDTVIQNVDRSSSLSRLRGRATIRITDRLTGDVRTTATLEDYVEFQPPRMDERIEGRTTDAWVRRVARSIVDELESPY